MIQFGLKVRNEKELQHFRILNQDYEALVKEEDERNAR
jgi:hypothetical protein